MARTNLHLSLLLLLTLAGCGGGAATPSATSQQPDPVRDPRAAALIGKALLPDLITQIPTDLVVERVASDYRLRFTNAYSNIGEGPLQIEGVLEGSDTHGIQHVLDAAGHTVATYDVSTFVWHPTHNHWHINNVARYELRKGAPDGPTVASSVKVTFCMIDLAHTYPNLRNSPANGFYFGCNDQFQGLSVGYTDEYNYGLDDQWIYITALPRGIYYLVSTVDPTHEFITSDSVGEGAWKNNAAWCKIRLDPRKETVEILDQGMGEPTFRK